MVELRKGQEKGKRQHSVPWETIKVSFLLTFKLNPRLLDFYCCIKKGTDKNPGLEKTCSLIGCYIARAILE